MADAVQGTNVVAAPGVYAPGAAPAAEPAFVAGGAAGHGGLQVGAGRLPLLSDLGDPFDEIPTFEEVVSDGDYPEVLPDLSVPGLLLKILVGVHASLGF